MRKSTLGLLAGGVLLTWLAMGQASTVVDDHLSWQTDVPKALSQAKAEKKLVLIDFTGSDWCVWCQKLDADTFAKAEFAAYAKTNLVLVQADYPSHKAQPDALKAANDALGKKFNVEGYPTLVALKPDGTVAWRNDGYLEGGPQALIEKLNGVSKP
jgi:protein disulfide-isomerase